MAATNWYKNEKVVNIPPLFGRPKPVKVDLPTYVPSQMWLVRLDNAGQQIEALRIQCVPLEIQVTPKSNWAVIPAIGRNNPFYHYTGGEDSISFTLDWYANHEYKEDVIEKCRWVESLSKANGYTHEPDRVVLIFGKLYQFDTWIIESAPYRLSMFDRSKGMLPQQAYQELTLNKVTPQNTTYDDIRYSNGKPVYSTISK